MLRLNVPSFTITATTSKNHNQHHSSPQQQLCNESHQLFLMDKYHESLNKISQCIQSLFPNSPPTTDDHHSIIQYLYLLNNYNVVKNQMEASHIVQQQQQVPNFSQLECLCDRVYGHLFLEQEEQNHHTIDSKLEFLMVYLTVCYNHYHCQVDRNDHDQLEKKVKNVLSMISLLFFKHRSKNSHAAMENDNGSLQALINQSFSREFRSFYHDVPPISTLNNGPTEQNSLSSKLMEYCYALKHDVKMDKFGTMTRLDLFCELQVLICRCVCLLAGTLVSTENRSSQCIELLLNDEDGSNRVETIIETTFRLKTKCASQIAHIDQKLMDHQWFVNDHAPVIQLSYLLLSMTHYFASDHSSAVRYCTRANELSKDCAAVLFLQGMILFGANRIKESRTFFERCVQLKSRLLFESLNMLGIVCSNEREFVMSLQYFQRALEVIQSSRDSVSRSRILLFYNISVQYERMKNVELQRKMLEVVWKTAIFEDPSGGEFSGQGSLSIPPSNAINQIPNAVQVMYMMAQSHLNSNSYDFAVNAYNFLFEVIVDGKHRDKYQGRLTADQTLNAFKEYIYLLLETHDYAKAESVCNHILRSHPDEIDTLLLKADVLLCQERDLKESDVLLKRCQTLLSKSSKLPQTTNKHVSAEQLVLVLNNSAMLMVCRDEIDAAIDQLTTALNIINDMNYDLPHGPQLLINVTYNICLLYRTQSKLIESSTMWLELRQLSFNALSYDSANNFLDSLRQRQIEQGHSPITSHVSGSVSQSQLLQMDIEVVSSLVSKLRS